MRTIKMLGLAVVAALSAMALVGATSAMATTATALCTEDVEPCPAGKLVSHVHELSLTKGVLLTTFPHVTIECDVLFLGDVENPTLLGAAGTPLSIKGLFTLSNCGNCTVTEIRLQLGVVTESLIELLREAFDLAKTTGKGLVLVNCPAIGLHCTYGGTGLVGHALGALIAEGHPGGEVRVESKSVARDPHEELSLCPSTSTLRFLIGALSGVNTYISK